MSQQYIYFSPTTPGNPSWSVDLGTAAVRLGDVPGFTQAAEAGDVGMSTVTIDDPTGTAGHSGDNIVGLKTFEVNESDCAAVGADGVNGQRLYTGYINARRYRRGTGGISPSLRTGNARRIEVDLADVNQLASFRIIYGAYSTLLGTLSKVSGNTTVTGSGTDFLTSLAIGSTISIPGGGGTDTLYVTNVGSDTSLTVAVAPTHSATGQTATRTDGNRPAETDVQRVQWIMSGIPAYFPVTNDAGYVDTSGPVGMDATDYTGQTPADVMHDCALASGKNWWVTYWEATNTDTLWYAFSESSTAYTSLLTLSNVLSDSSSTCYMVEPDAELTRDPSRVYAGVYLPFNGGSSYKENVLTSYTYAWRDGTAPNSNVSSQGAADAEALRLLGDADTEDDRITCRVKLPSTLATGIKSGQRLQYRNTAHPNYETAKWVRVVRCSPANDEETDKLYILTLELSPQAPAGSHLLVAYLAWHGTDPVDNSTHPWTLAYRASNFASGSQFPGPGATQGMALYYRTIAAGESTTVATFEGAGGSSDGTGMWVWEVENVTPSSISVVSGTDTQNPALNATPTISDTAASPSVLIGGFSLQKVDYGQVTQVSSVVGTELRQANSQNTAGTAGTCTVTADGRPPYSWMGYATGSGALTIGGTVSCTGAVPDYNLMGRGYAALLIRTSGAFGIVQSGFGGTTLSGTPFNVTLASPPTP